MLYFIWEKNFRTYQNYNFDLYSFWENTYQLIETFSLEGSSLWWINLSQWWELTWDSDYYYIVNVDWNNYDYASKKLSYNRATWEISTVASSASNIWYHIENYWNLVTLPSIQLPYTISAETVYTTSDNINVYNYLINFS